MTGVQILQKKRQKRANLELNIEYVIRAEMFILDKTNELLLASDWFVNYGIERSYVTVCTCARRMCMCFTVRRGAEP